MEQHAGLIIHLACGRSKHNLMTFFSSNKMATTGNGNALVYN